VANYGVQWAVWQVVADLIAEGQADPSILKELCVRHVGLRRAFTVAPMERGKAAGDADTDAELLVDALPAVLPPPAPVRTLNGETC
jgi:hypothetical protein